MQQESKRYCTCSMAFGNVAVESEMRKKNTTAKEKAKIIRS